MSLSTNQLRITGLFPQHTPLITESVCGWWTCLFTLIAQISFHKSTKNYWSLSAKRATDYRVNSWIAKQVVSPVSYRSLCANQPVITSLFPQRSHKSLNTCAGGEWVPLPVSWRFLSAKEPRISLVLCCKYATHSWICLRVVHTSGRPCRTGFFRQRNKYLFVSCCSN